MSDTSSRANRRTEGKPAINWLGQIPASWKVKRLKRIARFVGGGTPSKETPAFWRGDIPWVSPKDMKAPRIDDTEDHITADALRESATTIVPEGSLLLVVRSGILNHSIPVAIAGRDLTLNQDLKAVIVNGELLPDFLRYLITGHQRQLLTEWRKEGATVESLELHLVANTFIPLPSLNEQRAIAAFLDRETARIDWLVAKKDRLIEMLEERRTTLTTEAVTKGLDRAIPMKATGTESIGYVPAHWLAMALSRVTLSRCDGPFGSGLKSEHYSASGVRVIRLQNIGWAQFLGDDEAYVDEEYAKSLGDHSVLHGDLLVAGLGDEGHPVGRACAAPQGIEPAMVKADCFRFRLDQRRMLPEFAAYQLSATAEVTAGTLSTGATRSRMNLGATARRKIVLPPIEEQRRIVEHVKFETNRYTVLIKRVKDGIDHLLNLRTALISAAVTGKIDIREEVT